MKYALLKNQKYCCPECGSEVIENQITETCTLLGDDFSSEAVQNKCINEQKKEMVASGREFNSSKADTCFDCQYNVVTEDKGTLTEIKQIKKGNESPKFEEIHQCRTCKSMYIICRY